MFLFLKLVLAHLVADFVLQFEELYQLKVRSFLGQLLHVLIHGAIIAVLLLPYLSNLIIVAYVLFLMIEHLSQDLIKYHFTQKIPPQRFVFFMADQLLHLAVLALIFLFPASKEVRDFPGPVLLNYLYRDPTVTLFLIYFITLIFAGSYTLNSFYRTYIKPAQPLCWITSSEMTWAIIERSVIASSVLFTRNPLWVLASLFIGVFRLSFPNLRNLADFIVSAVYTFLLSKLFILTL